MLRKTFFTLSAVFVITAYADAGSFYLNMVVNPATTAGQGVSTANGTVTSNRSGPGTWQLYALDDLTDSFGISSYNITVTGTSANSNRSPSITYNDANGDPAAAGFTLTRSAANASPIAGAQDPSNFQITGMGREANNAAAKITGNTGITGAVSTQWGTYSANLASALPTGSTGKKWLLLSEGAYTGASPTVNTSSITVYTNSQGTGSRFVLANETVKGTPQAAGTPPTVQPKQANVNDANATGPGTPDVSIQNTATGDTPISWDNLQFVSYTPNYGGAGPYTPLPTSYSMTASGLFTWDTQGAHRGDYVFSKRATNAAGNNTGQDTIHVLGVPEPVTLALSSLALVGLLAVARRRG